MPKYARGAQIYLSRYFIVWRDVLILFKLLVPRAYFDRTRQCAENCGNFASLRSILPVNEI